jgi:hypothetical protein
MKRIENRSNEAVVHLHLSTQHTWPQLSVCLSCPFCISRHPQLGPVRFSSNRNKRKLTLGGVTPSSCGTTSSSTHADDMAWDPRCPGVMSLQKPVPLGSVWKGCNDGWRPGTPGGDWSLLCTHRRPSSPSYAAPS